MHCAARRKEGHPRKHAILLRTAMGMEGGRSLQASVSKCRIHSDVKDFSSKFSTNSILGLCFLRSIIPTQASI